MPAILKFHRLAWEELDAAASYYYAHFGGGGRFVAAAERTVGLIGTHPHVGRQVRKVPDGPAIRQFRIRGFPFAIVYIYLEWPPTITVFAIAHARRRPGYWRQRLKADSFAADR